MDSLDEIIRAHSNEGHTLSDSDFNELLAYFPNDEPMTIYRGLNFTTEEQANKFIKGIKDNGGYASISPSSWSKEKKVATEFARFKKTYNPTPLVMSLQREMSEKGEFVMGHGGFLLKATINSNEGAYVGNTNSGMEGEVLLPPNKTVKCEIIEIKGFDRQINEDGLDINKHIQGLDELDGPLLHFIFKSKKEEISPLSLEKITELANKNHHEQFSSLSDDVEILQEREGVYITKRSGTEGVIGINEKDVNYYTTHAPKLLLELFTDGIIQLDDKTVKGIANNYVTSAIKAYKLSEEDIKGVFIPPEKEVAYLASDFVQKTYSIAIGEKYKKEYELANSLSEIRGVNATPTGDKMQAIQNNLKRTEAAIKGIIDSLPERKSPKP